MDRREIEILITVMKLGSMTAAAATLNLAQPSVSKAIALTERRLGFRLFDRVKGRLKPTAEAGLVIEEALRIQDELSRFDRYVDSIRYFKSGQLRVAAMPASALSLLPLAAVKFRKSMPGYGLVLDMQLNHEIPRAVERGQYDLGLTVVPEAEETDFLRPIRRGRIVCVLPSSHALATQREIRWDDIDPTELVYVTTDARLVALLAMKLPGFDRRAASAIETNRYTIAVNLVRQRVGITVVDEFTLIGVDMEGLVVRPLQPKIALSFVAVTGQREAAKKAIPHFLSAIEAVFAASR